MQKNVELSLLAYLVGYRLRQSRHTTGLSQEEVAHGIVGQTMISLYETGKRIPQPEVLRLLGTRLNDEFLQEYANLIHINATLQKFIELDYFQLYKILVQNEIEWQPGFEIYALQLCEQLYNTGQYDDADRVCKIILNQVAPDTLTYISACYYHGTMILLACNYEEAINWLMCCYNTFDWVPKHLRGNLLYNLGYARFALERYNQAALFGLQAAELYLRDGDLTRHGRALALKGASEARTEQLYSATQSLEKAYEILSNQNNATLVDRVRVAVSLADVYESTHDWKNAEYMARQVIEVGTVAGDHAALSCAYSILARITVTKTNTKEAEQYLNQAMLHADQQQDPAVRGWVHLLAIGIHENLEERKNDALIAYKVSVHGHNDLLQAVSCEVLSQLQSGNPKESLHWLREAVVSYRQVLNKYVMMEPQTRFLPLIDQ